MFYSYLTEEVEEGRGIFSFVLFEEGRQHLNRLNSKLHCLKTDMTAPNSSVLQYFIM